MDRQICGFGAGLVGWGLMFPDKGFHTLKVASSILAGCIATCSCLCVCVNWSKMLLNTRLEGCSVNLSTNPSINHSIWICQSVYVCVSVFPSDLLAWPPVHFLAGLTQHLKRIRSLQLLLSPDLGLKAVSIFARARRVLLQPLIRFGRGLLVVVFETRISTHGLVPMTSAQHT